MFAPGAARWIGPPAVVAAVGGAQLVLRGIPGPVAVALLGGGVALTVFFAVFFRDPDRTLGPGIVSPADGRVRAVDQADGRWCVSVFMNVTDVHVNRAPIDGTVAAVEAAGAGYRAAYRADAGANVRRHYRLTTELGDVEIVQIAGTVARRIVPWVAAGATLRKGDRFGMIVLGSRVDLFFPSARARPAVRVGDRVWAGASTVAVPT